MRYQKFLPLFLLAFALAAPAAAQPGPQGVPPGHLPPPGECRVWYDDRPPGHQPSPTDCATARREAARTGGRVIFGDDREDGWDDDDWWNDDRRTTRFDRLDLNDDGFISRSEWPADVWIFDRFDRNDDNRLGRSEIRNPDLDRDDLMEERFRANDLNRDGRLSLAEWWGRNDRFELLDRNEDGFVSRSEFLSRRNVDRDDRGDATEERFRENDLNRDGRLSSREWWGQDTQFELLDRNGDDYLSLTEALERNPEDYRLSTRRFHGLDRNRDGRLSEQEWSGSLSEFNRRDRNDDGFLSLDEWLRRT
jgi:hypothetical protein